MNSGKSDTLIKTAYNYEERGLKVITIKPMIDTKGGNLIIARGGHTRKVDILADKTTDLYSKVLKFDDVSCVLVDESQFLQPKQVSQLYLLAKKADISVVCYGVRADFRTKIFPGSKRLMEIVDNIEKLPTMCSCGSQAEFNARKVNGKYVFSGDQVVIDGQGEVTYTSRCGNCYIKEGGKI